MSSQSAAETLVNLGTASLTERERAFVSYYLGEARLNATAAARMAGYSEPNAQSASIRHRPDVSAAIEQGLKERRLSSSEVLDEFVQIARQDLSPFISVDRRGTVKLDFKKALASGALRGVAGYEYNKQGRMVLKFHDKLAALQALGRHYKLFTDRIETSNPEGLALLRQYLGTESENDGDQEGA